MKNFNIKIGVLALTIALGTLTSCEQENDELLMNNELSNTDKVVKEEGINLQEKGTCNTSFFQLIDAISGTDYNDGVSTLIDDRSCSHDYYQWDNFGVYKLSASDNDRPDNPGSLQVRMERTTSDQPFGNGKYLEIEGTVKVNSAGSVTDNKTYSQVGDGDGTYLAQVKGKHTIQASGEPNDPAIVLFRVSPKRRDNGKGTIIKQNNKVKDFVIYAELTTRRGSASGRRMIYITTVPRNTDFDVKIRSEFYTQNGVKRQRVKYTINGVSKTHTISALNSAGQVVAPIETRTRMGAYRCKGGSADIRWNKDLVTRRN